MPLFDPQSTLSSRTSALKEAAIIVMSQKARELRAAGHDVVSLSIGEPDFDTPAHICDAATLAMKAGHTHYAPIPGIPELRKALSHKLKTENNVDYDWTEIVLSNGAKQAIANAIFATIDEGDEVILIKPYWVAYEGLIKLAGGVPVYVEALPQRGFKPRMEDLEAAMTDKTKLVIINTPNNPSGAMFTRPELEALAAVIISHPRALVVSDEIYEYIRFEGEHVSIASLEGMRERTIIINGFSKGFAMTGWRIGYSAGPEPIARAMSKIQGTISAGGNSFAQHGALAALEGPLDCVEDMRQEYLARRDLMVSGLAGINGISISPPPGSFYAFADVSSLLSNPIGNQQFETADDLAHWLLETHHVATVPGSAFGMEGTLRLSFATSRDNIQKALHRLKAAFNT